MNNVLSRYCLRLATVTLAVVLYVLAPAIPAGRLALVPKDECHFILFHKPGKTGSTTIGDALQNVFLREGYSRTSAENSHERNLDSVESMVCREKKLFTHSHLVVEDRSLRRWRSCCNVVMITSIRDPHDRMISEYFHVHPDLAVAWKNDSKQLVADSFATWYKSLNHDRLVTYTLGNNSRSSVAERFDFIFENSAIADDCERFSVKFGVTLACSRRARDNGIINYDVLSYLSSALYMDFHELKNERLLYETLYHERLRRIYS
jgi:Sulfotransferase family